MRGGIAMENASDACKEAAKRTGFKKSDIYKIISEYKQRTFQGATPLSIRSINSEMNKVCRSVPIITSLSVLH